MLFLWVGFEFWFVILICLLYTCAVWIESVDPVADLRLTNQVLYRTILSITAESLIARVRDTPPRPELPKVALRAHSKINRDRCARLVSSNRARFAHYRYYTNISHSLYAGGPINASSGFGLWAKTLREQLRCYLQLRYYLKLWRLNLDLKSVSEGAYR